MLLVSHRYLSIGLYAYLVLTGKKANPQRLIKMAVNESSNTTETIKPIAFLVFFFILCRSKGGNQPTRLAVGCICRVSHLFLLKLDSRPLFFYRVIVSILGRYRTMNSLVQVLSFVVCPLDIWVPKIAHCLDVNLARAPV